MYVYITSKTNDSTVVNLPDDRILFTNQLIKPMVPAAAIRYEKLKDKYSDKESKRT